jgi:DNA polymerase-3 subunit alpha
MGITVLPPDVNCSARDFAAVGDDIRFGLCAVRNVGCDVVDSITRARNRQAPFTDFFDFFRKVDAAVCNRRVVESLIKAGAFDSLGRPRKGLYQVHRAAIDIVMASKRAAAIGQLDLFGDPTPDAATSRPFDVPVPAAHWDTRRQLAFERDMLGCYVSGHPLQEVEHLLADRANTPIASIKSGRLAKGAQVIVGGVLTGLTRRVNRDGEPWAAAQLEDLSAGTEVLFFAQTYAEVGPKLAENAIVLVRGWVASRNDTISLIAGDMVIPDLT